jgi:hypothetical protein
VSEGDFGAAEPVHGSGQPAGSDGDRRRQVVGEEVAIWGESIVVEYDVVRGSVKAIGGGQKRRRRREWISSSSISITGDNQDGACGSSKISVSTSAGATGMVSRPMAQIGNFEEKCKERRQKAL